MGLLKLQQVCVGFMVMLVVVMVGMQSVEPSVTVRFDRAPSPRSRLTTAVFHYSIVGTNGSNACKDQNGCSVHCELDGHTLTLCPAGSILLNNLVTNRRHNFLLNVTTGYGEKNSSAYKWFIDTIPPTASISSQRNYTSAAKTAIDITFSEPCSGLGGLKCLNTSICDVMVFGPAQVDASTLHMLKPYTQYSLIVDFSLKSSYERVIVQMADKFCTDQAGNRFTRTNSSVIVLHFDRRQIHTDLRTSVPSYELRINKVPRIVRATNRMEDLKFSLGFSDPIINSTIEIVKVLHANVGNLIPIQTKNDRGRRFFFELRNVARTEVVAVILQSTYLLGRSGIPVSSVSPTVFMYDATKPRVKLTTKTPGVSKESVINVIVEFTKPVFGFQTSAIEVGGGGITRFKEHSKALYSLTVLGTSHDVISIFVPGGRVNDVAGNLNLASNKLEVRLYTPPAISVALHSFVTAGLLATSLAASILSFASTNLGAIGASTSRSVNLIVSDPSLNLLGMVGHLQVFVFSGWISVHLPIEYSETVQGLRWLIPREKLPWKRERISKWTNNDFPSEDLDKLSKPRNLSVELHNGETSKVIGQHGEDLGMRDALYGLPLDFDEYSVYFFREEPQSAFIKRMENYTGWEDLKMNLFWLGMAGGSLVSVHILILIFLRWRTGTSVHGTLSVPRFELFLLVLMIPCIAQSSAFVIRGGTTVGIITGALLLAIPTALILSVCLFLIIAIFTGGFVQYKEIKRTGFSEPWHAKLLVIFMGRRTMGKWFYREGLPVSFLPRFGFLFEDRKGPPVFVLVDQNDRNSVVKWIDSGQTGIGRMRALDSNNSNEETQVSVYNKLLGSARSAYIILDLLRRLCLGIISGMHPSQRPHESIIALSFTVVQLLSLLALKPYISRGVHVVESISLICEAALFGLSLYVNHLDPTKERTMGIVILALLLISFLSQLVNEWYALVKCLLRLPQSRNPSFRLGMKFVAKGLIFPFLPRKHWSKLVPGTSQPNTGLVPVLPLSPETRMSRREKITPGVDTLNAMTATIVPMCSPGSPSLTNIQATETTTAEPLNGQGAEGKRPEVKVEPRKSEMRKLRELAKASFSGSSKVERGSGSYVPGEQCGSDEESSNSSLASSQRKKH